jgi:hypothetical protein
VAAPIRESSRTTSPLRLLSALPARRRRPQQLCPRFKEAQSAGSVSDRGRRDELPGVGFSRRTISAASTSTSRPRR